MKAQFLSELDIKLTDNDCIWTLESPLVYYSELLDVKIEVPTGFETDFASVPRVPIAYMFYGGRCHREAVIHDYLYRTNSIPVVTFMQANDVFLEAMKVRGKSWGVRFPMYWGVCSGGYFSYHKRRVEDKL